MGRAKRCAPGVHEDDHPRSRRSRELGTCLAKQRALAADDGEIHHRFWNLSPCSSMSGTPGGFGAIRSGIAHAIISTAKNVQ